MTREEFYLESDLANLQLENDIKRMKAQAKIQILSQIAEKHVRNGFISLGDVNVVECLFEGKITNDKQSDFKYHPEQLDALRYFFLFDINFFPLDKVKDKNKAEETIINLRNLCQEVGVLPLDSNRIYKN